MHRHRFVPYLEAVESRFLQSGPPNLPRHALLPPEDELPAEVPHPLPWQAPIHDPMDGGEIPGNPPPSKPRLAPVKVLPIRELPIKTPSTKIDPVV